MRQSPLLVFMLVFLSALTLYVSTAAPSLTWAHFGTDGGDLISAAMTNGVPHPPGYPIYVTLGQLIAHVPIGDIAYRFNLFSAVCMALAAGITALNILRLAPTLPLPRFSGEGVAIIASLFFVTAPMVWGQATIAEVHALNAFLVALIVYLITPSVFRGSDVSLRCLTLAAGLWGIAFGNSLTVAALAPLMIVTWRRGRRETARGRPQGSPLHTGLPIVAFLLGLSVYALIPLRAAQQPPINWGDATSLDRFFALITAEMYRGYVLSTPPTDLLSRLIAFGQLIVTQYGWFGVFLSTIGLYYALVSTNRNWRWLATTLLLYLFFALTYSAADSALYLIPAWMFGTWAIARGLFAITQYASRVAQYAASIALIIVLLLGPVFTVLNNFSTMNLRTDWAATSFANSILSAAPLQAIVITANDGHTFALWYHRHIAGQRPDLAIVDERLAGYPWYAVMLRAQGAVPALPVEDPSSTWIDRVAELNPDRAVCVIDAESAQLACPP